MGHVVTRDLLCADSGTGHGGSATPRSSGSLGSTHAPDGSIHHQRLFTELAQPAKRPRTQQQAPKLPNMGSEAHATALPQHGLQEPMTDAELQSTPIFDLVESWLALIVQRSVSPQVRLEGTHGMRDARLRRNICHA